MCRKMKHECEQNSGKLKTKKKSPKNPKPETISIIFIKKQGDNINAFSCILQWKDDTHVSICVCVYIVYKYKKINLKKENKFVFYPREDSRNFGISHR